MSESLKVNTTNSKRRAVFFITAIAAFIILGLGYLGGYFILPGLIKSAYKNTNCELVLSRGGVYTSIYPSIIVDTSIPSLVRECAVFTLAVNNESGKEWHDSYNAFDVYSKTYPDGLFAVEARQRSATVLIDLAKEEVKQKQYTEAVGNLDLVFKDFSDTDAFAEAEYLKSDLYIPWGEDLRNSGDYEEAEKVFNEFKIWTENDQDAELAKSAQSELAQTYLAWGLSLQSQKRFDEAKSKLDMTMSTDPDPQSKSGPAAQVEANRVRFYSEWGDYLIEQNDFSGAMEQYGTATTLSKSHDPNANTDILAKGYIQWAAGLIVEEDFIGALVLLDFAQENASTDSIKKMVDDARTSTYLAFSESSGEQAQKAMRDAVAIVCEHHINPTLPIFGLNADDALFGIYGADDNLPTNLAATTPGSLHYATCLDEESKLVGSATHRIYKDSLLFVQIQYFWKVSLRQVETGNEINMTQVEGGKPPPLPTEPAAIMAGVSNPTYFGPKPDVTDLADWLTTAVK